MAETGRAPSNSLLDRWPARLLALAVAAAVAGFLYRIAPDVTLRTDSLPSGSGATVTTQPNDAAFTACLAKDKAAIDNMRREGLADDTQAELFLTRAEARCRATSGQ